MDLNLLFTNATVADDAIRFVAEHDRSKHKFHSLFLIYK
jgi:hypothetical protein